MSDAVPPVPPHVKAALQVAPDVRANVPVRVPELQRRPDAVDAAILAAEPQRAEEADVRDVLQCALPDAGEPAVAVAAVHAVMDVAAPARPDAMVFVEILAEAPVASTVAALAAVHAVMAAAALAVVAVWDYAAAHAAVRAALPVAPHVGTVCTNRIFVSIRLIDEYIF